MKKLIVLIIVSSFALASDKTSTDKAPATSSPTKSGHTLRKATGAQKHARDKYFAQQGQDASLKKARKRARNRFATKAFLNERNR